MRKGSSVGAGLAEAENTYVQLCGRFVVELHGRHVEQRLPGRQGRVLFAYLVLQRPRAVGRHELIEAIWADAPPANQERGHGREPSMSTTPSRASVLLLVQMEPAGLPGRSSSPAAWAEASTRGIDDRRSIALAKTPRASVRQPGLYRVAVSPRGTCLFPPEP